MFLGDVIDFVYDTKESEEMEASVSDCQVESVNLCIIVTCCSFC